MIMMAIQGKKTTRSQMSSPKVCLLGRASQRSPKSLFDDCLQSGVEELECEFGRVISLCVFFFLRLSPILGEGGNVRPKPDFETRWKDDIAAIWARPIAKLPVHTDVPRLAKKITIKSDAGFFLCFFPSVTVVIVRRRRFYF